MFEKTRKRVLFKLSRFSRPVGAEVGCNSSESLTRGNSNPSLEQKRAPAHNPPPNGSLNEDVNDEVVHIAGRSAKDAQRESSGADEPEDSSSAPAFSQNAAKSTPRSINNSSALVVPKDSEDIASRSGLRRQSSPSAVGTGGLAAATSPKRSSSDVRGVAAKENEDAKAANFDRRETLPKNIGDMSSGSARFNRSSQSVAPKVLHSSTSSKSSSHSSHQVQVQNVTDVPSSAHVTAVAKMSEAIANFGDSDTLTNYNRGMSSGIVRERSSQNVASEVLHSGTGSSTSSTTNSSSSDREQRATAAAPSLSNPHLATIHAASSAATTPTLASSTSISAQATPQPHIFLGGMLSPSQQEVRFICILPRLILSTCSSLFRLQFSELWCRRL